MDVMLKDALQVIDKALCGPMDVVHHIIHGDLGVCRHPDVEGPNQIGLLEPVFEGFDPEVKIVALLKLII